ncbi:hypothetical protein SAMN05421678_12225 [Actinopolymorpha cephalotaxi]|uniref:DUF3024 domain-containing protein n=1 Tax=Actinopolymorpha cephalotaxi TaxID=504797 RepID=A0A1I3B4V1_9ACTN|nr:hypothetical protein [Actinopolymorpha cephalotaxi]NYH81238.1 hypothetical protein [Actinopolymorpha cephalotaxi]SFH57116.1 hypothetical protein SAMN05421678_12225 [Actinopolymorpha cephalotaxi]
MFETRSGRGETLVDGNAPPVAITTARQRAHELADLFARDGIAAEVVRDDQRSAWGVRVTEPADERLFMCLWLRDGRWTWVPGCAFDAEAGDYLAVLRFATVWITEHRVAL